MSKHTPGPWTWGAHNHGLYGSNAEPVLQWEPYEGMWLSGLEGKADINARLIAAAPDLLETLKDLCSFETELTQDKWDRARDMIAKAEGKDHD